MNGLESNPVPPAAWRRAMGRLAPVALAAWLGVGAAAQPVQLTPEPEEPALAPTEPVPTAEASRIEIDTLNAPDLSGLGTLTDENGGLGANMWQGSRRALIERLLPQLPAATTSPVMQSLTRRVLLTAATVPAGQASGPSLLGLRAERLLAAGAIADLNQLLALGPSVARDPLLVRAATDSQFLGGADIAACALVQRVVREDQNPHWLKAMVHCRAVTGDKPQASLAVALLREQGVDDPIFYAAADALLTGTKLTSLRRAGPLHVAMLRLAKLAPPADALNGAEPAVLAALANLAEADIETALGAAEQAQAFGVLATSDLAKRQGAIKFTDAERQAGAKAGDRGAKSAALLHQSANSQTVPIGRAEALRRVWNQARERGLYATAARVNLATLLQLAPAPELVFVAADAMRAALAAGAIDHARVWAKFLGARPADADRDAATTLARFWPFSYFTELSGGPWRQADYEKWLAASTGGEAGANERRAVLVLLLAEAIGQEVAPELWDTLDAVKPAASDAGVSAVLRRGLAQAAKAGRRGETALYALIALGPNGPAQADTPILAEAVAALHAVGLKAEARALIVEALLARGF